VGEAINTYVDLLERYFERIEPQVGFKIPIEREWSAQISGTYSPRIDIAIGPFAIYPGRKRVNDYDRLVESSKDFIELLIKNFEENKSKYELEPLTAEKEPSIFSFLSESGQCVNPNSRCFMAIEIEGEGKHLKRKLGSIINASAMGRIGLMIAEDEECLKKLLNLLAYLHFLKEVRKPSFNAGNIIIITEKQFNSILAEINK